jgi:hypothetical protein
MQHRTVICACSAIAALALASCQTDSSVSPNGGPFPKKWVLNVTNPFFPLISGTIYVYRGETVDGTEVDSVEVLKELHDVNGVAATEVHDRVFVNGALIEDTRDWYAQDTDGNVWYLGENTRELDNGQVVDTSGSFAWGVDGAQPGIIMWGDPTKHVGEPYRQEFLSGQAEDWGKVVALNQSISVPAGSFTGCLETEDWNGLEPSTAHEHKFYCPDVGVVDEMDSDGQSQLQTLHQSPTLRAASSRP